MSYRNRSKPLLVLLTCIFALGVVGGIASLWPTTPAVQPPVVQQPAVQQPDVPPPAPTPEPTPFIESVGQVQPDGSLYFGYKPDPEKTKAFVASLPSPNLTEASPGLFVSTADVDVFSYRAFLAAWKERFGRDFIVGKQGIGDCVSWGWAHGLMMHEAVNYANGETSEWHAIATESIYGGSRVEARGRQFGGYSDGSYGSAAAKWVREWGVTYRQAYDGVDLTEYSAQRAKDWGNFGNGGRDDNGRLDAIAKQFPCGEVTLVRNFDEAAAAIRSGYMVPVCSQQGFSTHRDRDAFANPEGSWAHCMVFCAVRYGARPGLLCLNSWGPDWIDGPKYPDDMPEGSFWVDRRVVDRMLAGEDSFAVSRLKGFPFRPIDHAEWASLPHSGGLATELTENSEGEKPFRVVREDRVSRDRDRDTEPIFALAP